GSHRDGRFNPVAGHDDAAVLLEGLGGERPLVLLGGGSVRRLHDQVAAAHDEGDHGDRRADGGQESVAFGPLLLPDALLPETLAVGAPRLLAHQPITISSLDHCVCRIGAWPPSVSAPPGACRRPRGRWSSTVPGRSPGRGQGPRPGRTASAARSRGTVPAP